MVTGPFEATWSHLRTIVAITRAHCVARKLGRGELRRTPSRRSSAPLRSTALGLFWCALPYLGPRNWPELCIASGSLRATMGPRPELLGTPEDPRSVRNPTWLRRGTWGCVFFPLRRNHSFG